MKLNKYKKIWEDYLLDNYFPTNLRELITIEFDIFKNMVYNDNEKTKKLILDVLSGDVVILKNAIPEDVAKQIKKDLYEYGNNNPESDFKTNKLISNFHIKSNFRKGDILDDKKGTRTYKVKDGYNEIGHSYYFYRWNPDKLNMFKRIDDVWDTVKIFNGLDINEYKNNVPKDGIIDQIQAIQYPINSGEISPHCDMSRWQKTNLTFSLTKKGVDFGGGGQYFFNKKWEKVSSESGISVGDASLFISTIFHGVDIPISPDKNVNWKKIDGRWQLLTTSIQSQCVKDRVISYSLKNYKKDPKKVLELYKKKYVNID